MAKTELQLEQGKLYQVYFNKKWVIGEYVRTCEPRTERYSDCWLGGKNGMEIGPEKTRLVPRTHCWKRLDHGSGFQTPADSDLRPVTEECIAEIARLRDEIKQNDLHRVALLRELRALTQ